MNDTPDLHPARPEAQEERAYMPKLPWKWILGIGGFLLLSVGVYQVRERQEVEVLRAGLLKTHQSDLAPIVARYEDITGKVRKHTAESARAAAPTPFVDPRLNLDALGTSPGLYLRLTPDQFAKAADLDHAKLDEAPDAIGRCLGIAPMSAGELLARGSFLTPAWIKQAEDADSLMKLRVVAEELRQRSERDLPTVLEALKAQWFLLALERGENRRDAPVDVYLWDLHSDQLLLRARTQASGALVTARIAVGGVKPGHYGTGAQTGAAQDCSIAGQLRAMVGGATPTFESQPPSPQQPTTPSSTAAQAAPTVPSAPTNPTVGNPTAK
jgi:hypothetical protein